MRFNDFNSGLGQILLPNSFYQFFNTWFGVLDDLLRPVEVGELGGLEGVH